MAQNYLCGGCTAKDLYFLWNLRYFKGQLPSIPVRWVLPCGTERRSRNTLGCTVFKRVKSGRKQILVPIEIRLHPKTKNQGSVWAATLLHEMVHVEQWELPREQAHGNKFQRRMKQLAQQGAFNGLW